MPFDSVLLLLNPFCSKDVGCEHPQPSGDKRHCTDIAKVNHIATTLSLRLHASHPGSLVPDILFLKHNNEESQTLLECIKSQHCLSDRFVGVASPPGLKYWLESEKQEFITQPSNVWESYWRALEKGYLASTLSLLMMCGCKSKVKSSFSGNLCKSFRCLKNQVPVTILEREFTSHQK